jgi:hypothetical protein
MTKDTDKRRWAIGSHMRQPTWVRGYSIVGGHSRMHETRRAGNMRGAVMLRRCSNSRISRISGEHTQSWRTFIVLRVDRAGSIMSVSCWWSRKDIVSICV